MYERRLSPGFAVVGISRTPMSDDEFHQKMRESVQKFLEDSPFDNDVWAGFSQGLYYMSGDVNDAEMYTRLAARLTAIEQSRRTGRNVLFYLSTQPSQYGLAAKGLRPPRLQHGHGWPPPLAETPLPPPLPT